MKRLLAGLAALLLLPISLAAALDQASSPQKFPLVWGASAGSAYIRSIPSPSQIGVQNCAASLTDGFPPLTFVPSSAGGCPPFGQDFNGILRQITQWSQWGQAGGPIYYDSAFAAAVNGYPAGARVLSSLVPNTVWVSTVDNNTSNPDTAGAGWIQDPGRATTGTIKPSMSTAIPPGWLALNGLTIGNASSGATNFASPTNALLFAYIWTNCPDSECPVSGGRGASGAADFAANKTIQLWDTRGTGLTGVQTMQGNPTSRLAGVPVISGSVDVPGSLVGENTHVLSAGEAPTITAANAAQGISVSGTIGVSGTVTGTTTVSGTVSVSGDVGAGGRFIPTSSGAVSSLQAASAATSNITPANDNGNWAGATTLSGSMSGLNSMSGDNSMSGILSGLNGMSGNNSISVTSNNTGGGAHNNVELSLLVYWLVKL